MVDFINEVLEGMDDSDISSILDKWRKVTLHRKELEKIDDMLKDKVKIFLKEKKWVKYLDDDTKISVSLSSQRKETIDMRQLKRMITPNELALITKVTEFEKLIIMTPEAREKLKKNMR